MYIAKLTYDRIIHLSEKNKIQISKINELCSISKDTLSASARSKEGMKAKKLYDISVILNCSVDYLLGRTDDPNACKSTMSENELALLKRYAELDSHGKSLVDTIIDKEYDRCTKSKIIKTPKGEYKTAYAAAFGGGTTEINIPANVSPDEINRMIDETTAEQQRIENEKIGDEIIEKVNKNK